MIDYQRLTEIDKDMERADQILLHFNTFKWKRASFKISGMVKTNFDIGFWDHYYNEQEFETEVLTEIVKHQFEIKRAELLAEKTAILNPPKPWYKRLFGQDRVTDLVATDSGATTSPSNPSKCPSYYNCSICTPNIKEPK